MDMFSSDSEAEPDSGDEKYDADCQAFAAGVNLDAEPEATAADEIQEGIPDDCPIVE